MDLSDINTIKRVLSQNGFSFKKSLGQNFLTDETVCPRMADYAADGETGVLEIGPGMGVLTKELSKRARRVVALEVDERLRPVLDTTLEGCDNVKVIFGDAMKLDLRKIITENFADCKSVNVCANLPYYITSPIIMGLLESRLPIEKIVVMVQKEAGERFCAEVSSREAGAVTVAAEYYAESEILFFVGRESFFPPPNVDSCVVAFSVRKEPPVKLKSEKKFFKFVKACFALRRKTLVNSVSASLGIEKAVLCEALGALDINESIRAEKLTLTQLADLANALDGEI